LSGIQLSDAGSYSVSVSNTQGSIVSSPATLTVNLPAIPTALSYSNMAATYAVGREIVPNIPAHSGGRITSYSVAPPLPSGLSLDPKSGWITGRPANVQAETTYTITGRNAAGATTRSITIRINSVPIDSFAYSPSSVTLTTHYSFSMIPQIDLSDPTTIFTVSPSLPPGISLDSVTGVISGTPLASWVSSEFTVQAQNLSSSKSALIYIFPDSGSPRLRVSFGGRWLSNGETVNFSTSLSPISRSFIYENNGTGTLIIGTPLLTKPYRAGSVGFYVPTQALSMSLNPGMSSSFNVSLGSTALGPMSVTPTNSGTGNHSNVLLIPTNDPSLSGGVFRINVEGTLQNVFDLNFQVGASPVISGETIDLGAASFGGAPISRTISVGHQNRCDDTNCIVYDLYVGTQIVGINSPFQVSPANLSFSKLSPPSSLTVTFDPRILPTGQYKDLLLVNFCGVGFGNVTNSGACSTYFFPIVASIQGTAPTAQAFSLWSNGEELDPRMMLFLGSTPRGETIVQRIGIKNTSGLRVRVLANSAGQTLKSLSPDEFSGEQLSVADWEPDEIRYVNVAFHGSTQTNVQRTGSLLFIYSNGSSQGYFFINLAGMSPNRIADLAAQNGGLTLKANQKLIANGQPTEVDLRAEVFGALTQGTDFELANNGSNPITINQISVDTPTDIILPSFTSAVLNPGQKLTFNLKLDTSSSGVKAARVRIRYQGSQNFDFPVGGMVWHSDDETFPPCSGADCYEHPSPPANPFYTAYASETLALLNAETKQAFAALINTLSYSYPESVLQSAFLGSDIGRRLFELVVASNRFFQSLGAHYFVAGWFADLLAARRATAGVPVPPDLELKRQIYFEIQNFIFQKFESMTNDPYCSGRSHALLSLTNNKEMMLFVRSFAAYMLLRGVDTIPHTNAYGRYICRNALVSAYLHGTNPSFEDASPVLVSVLNSVTDPYSRGAVVAAINSQFPELFVALQSRENP
jgi:hypothetical protein